MKLLFIFYFFLSSLLLWAQEDCMEDLPKVNLIKCDFNFLLLNQKLLKDVKFSELNPKCQWAYFLRQSVNRLYLDSDSSSYFLEAALGTNLKGTCKYILFAKTVFEIKSSQGKEEGYKCFYTNLPENDQFLIDSLCQHVSNELAILESNIRDSTLTSEIIRRRDEKYRKVEDMEKQVVLDLENRNFIDSLYLLKGSLDVFDEEDIYQFSIVAHHSDDCDWVYKWTERFIAHVSNGYKGKIFLGPMLDRMFAKDGYCTEQDHQKRDYFIYMIKSKYPEFVKSYPLE